MLKNSEAYPAGLDIPIENRRRLSSKTGRTALHTPPAMGPDEEVSFLGRLDPRHDHYPHLYKHDSDYSAMAYARHDSPRLAIEEIFSLFEGQNPSTGFIPNMQFADFGRWYDPEPWTFMNRRLQSDYTQPPLEAKAVAETFDACVRLEHEADGRLFLEEIYPKLKKSYEYFINHRQNSDDIPLVGIIHPHETGRDSDPTFDFIKWRLPRNGRDTPVWKDLANSALDYGGALTQNVKNRLKSWEVNKIREQFWVNDVMYNSMLGDNYNTFANIADYLGKTEDAARFKELSVQVFNQVSTKMWDASARDGEGAFYALNKDGRKIPEISVSNLFPLLNPNLPEDQLVSLLKLIQKSFTTNYMLPTVATDSPNYDPDYQGKGIMWRGPVWLWMNDGIAEGLERQFARKDISPSLRMRSRVVAYKIRKDSKKLSHAGYETNNPITGEDQRMPHFSANAIGYLAARESILIAA